MSTATLTPALIHELVQHLDDNEMTYAAIGVAVVVASAQLRGVPFSAEVLTDNDHGIADDINDLVAGGYLARSDDGLLIVDPDEMAALASPHGIAD